MGDSPMNPYGKFFTGAGQTQVELGFYSKKNAAGGFDVLMRVTGKAAHDEGVDGKVLKCVYVPGPNNGADYQYQDGDKTYTRLSMRKGWDGKESYELFVSTETIVLKESENAAEVKPAHLLTAFEQETKK